MKDALRVTVYDGKYTVVMDASGGLRALRHGEEWRDLTGDGLVLALAQEIEELRSEIQRINGVCAEWERDMKGTLSALESERAKNKKMLRALVDFMKVADPDGEATDIWAVAARKTIAEAAA